MLVIYIIDLLCTIYTAAASCSSSSNATKLTSNQVLLFLIFRVQHGLERERLEGQTQAFVELAHELHPEK